MEQSMMIPSAPPGIAEFSPIAFQFQPASQFEQAFNGLAGCHALAIGHGHELGDWPTVLGDGDLPPLLDFLKQGGKMRLGFEGADGLGHIDLL
jgi:hypothetical protein